MDVHAIRTGSVRVRERQLQGAGSGSRRLLNTLLDKRWTPPLPIHAWPAHDPGSGERFAGRVIVGR